MCPDEGPWGTPTAGRSSGTDAAQWAPAAGGLAYNGDEAQWAAAEPQSATVTWQPLNQQVADPDTTYLLDPATDPAPGYGGMVPQRGVATPSIVAGKYRQGVQSASASSFFAVPLDGILGARQFTVEFWAMNPTTDWGSVNQQTILVLGNLTGTNDYVAIEIWNGILAKLHHNQVAAAIGVTKTATKGLATGVCTPGTFHNIAFTLNAGTLTLYLDAVQVASVGSIVNPIIWSGDAYKSGILLPYSPSWVISDLRISRTARTPGAPITVSDLTTITVSNTPTGATVQPLAGFLHELPPNASGDAHNPASTADAQQIATRGATVVRTDKLLTCTPIVAGPPDASHPTAGHSGAYSYDWQVVDRSVRYISETLGCEPYISIDGNVQILGGSVSPFAGIQLTQGYAYQCPQSNGPVTNTAAYAQMAGDLVYHILNELTLTHPPTRWGLWNEPDQSWLGTLAQYEALFAAVASAVKAVSAAAKFGGPEVASWGTAGTTWIQPLIAYCGANAVPLDFISFHFYDGNVMEADQLGAQIPSWCTAAGIALPELICGEWCWQSANEGYWPWRQPHTSGSAPPAPYSDIPSVDYLYNDWHAGFTANVLNRFQANGVTRAIVDDFFGLTAAGQICVDQSGIPQSTYSVLRLWTMMRGGAIVQTTLSSAEDPGLTAVACTLGGHTYVALGFLRYRKDRTPPVTIDVSAYGYPDGTVATVYPVNDKTGDAFDAGSANAALSSSTTSLSAGKISITPRPRGALLVKI